MCALNVLCCVAGALLFSPSLGGLLISPVLNQLMCGAAELLWKNIVLSLALSLGSMGNVVPAVVCVGFFSLLLTNSVYQISCLCFFDLMKSPMMIH